MQSSQLSSSGKKGKVLLYLFGSLGDTLVAIPALRAVRRNYPDAALILLQNDPSGNNAEVSKIIPEELIDGYVSYNSQSDRLGKISVFYRLWNKLRQQKFQAVIYLVSCERPARSVSRDKFFFRSCGIPRLIGFHPFSKEKLYPLDSKKRPAMTNNEAVLKLKRLQTDEIEVIPEKDFQLPLLNFSDTEMESINKWLADRRKKPNSRLIAIAPGCKTRANVWSLENFIQIGHKLIADENCELLVIGGKAECEAGKKMISDWGEGINAAGEFSVRKSGALLSKCDFLIGLDTGTTHLAASVGTRCFAIYGERNNQGHWYPLGNGHTIIFHPVKCAGCRLFVCPLPDHPCMKNISVESVWQNWKKFVSGKYDGANSLPVKTVAV